MQQLRNYGDERQMAFCIHCGGNTRTRDHVPSRIFLDEPYPPNPSVVPACEPCNGTFSKDEEYLACLVECARVGLVCESAVQRDKVRSILREKPKLALRLAQAQMETGSSVSFSIEAARARNVFVKLGRGHAAFELNEPRYDDPSIVTCVPLPSMPEEVRRRFETPPGSGIWPEVGSRAMQRLALSDTGTAEWIVVQPARYRYLASVGDGVLIRMVVSEYLACEVLWAEA
jgi:hypothetical protein